MSSVPILNTLNDLGSSKTRERNNALDELTSILKQSPDLIPTKTLASTCETLIELLDSEYRKYCQLIASNDATTTRLSSTENRLSLVAYVLRLFIEKTCSRFKVRTLKLLLAVLPELMVAEGSRTLIEPISVHLTFALHALIKSKPFQLKMLLHQWVSLVSVVCSYLTKKFEVSLTDRDVSNLIAILHSLLGIDCVGLSQVREIIYRTLLEYLRRSQKVNSNTRLVLCMINEFIVKTHCTNILDTLHLLKETWRHVVAINVSANEPIQDELSYLDIFASELIVHNIPAMIGSEEAVSDCCSSSLHGICREYLISRLLGCKASSLSVEHLQFSQSFGNRNSFLDVGDISLKHESPIEPWLRVLSITRLTMSYFRLLQKDIAEQRLFKRHKCDPSISSILRNSQSSTSFLLNGINSSDTNIQLLCLQMTAFTASLQDLAVQDVSDLKSAVELKFDNINLIKWACITLIPLFSQVNFQDSEIENSLNRLFKLCLPLIKQPELCPVACSLLTSAMKRSSQVPDKATLGLIASVYELSDVNGPGRPCNEAFQFWQYLQSYGKISNTFSLNFISNKVISWVETKWQQIIPLQENQSAFYEFISWLCDRKRTRSESTHTGSSLTTSWRTSLQKRYELWTSQLEERFFILQTEAKGKTSESFVPETAFDNVAVDNIRLNDILYRLLELIEGENGLSLVAKFRWICQVANLAENLSGDSRFVSYLLDFQRAASTILRKIELSDKISYAVLFRSILSLEATATAHLVFDELPIERIMIDLKELLLQNLDNQQNFNVLDFDVSFDRGIPDAQTGSNEFAMKVSVGPLVSLALKASLTVLQHRLANSPQEIMTHMMHFLNGMKPDHFISCLDPMLTWIQQNERVLSSESSQLQHFTETICYYLLQSEFNTSNTGAYYLCLFLNSVSSMWLGNSEGPLNADCCDIFDWLIARFDDTSINERLTVRALSQLLLCMLKSHDLSRGHVNGGKQRVFSAYSKSLKALDVTDVISELPFMMDYMTKISSKNQHILFQEICDLVNVPQQSIEMSALYSLAMYKISTASHLNMSLSIRDLMQYSHFEHTRVYIASALKEMTLDTGLSDVRQLFDIFRFDILSLWFDESCRQARPLEEVWDIRIFGFSEELHFLKLYSAEISALSLSRIQKPNILNALTKFTGGTEKQLLLKYYYLILPLSFIAGGLGEDIYESFEEVTGRALSTIKNRTLIFRWILKFIDLGSNYETSSMIERHTGSNSAVQNLYYPHSNSTRYEYPLHIPLETGWGLLHQLLNKCPCCKDEINFILLSILSDLETSLYCSEKLKCLREMKFALVINENSLSTCHFLSTFLPPLCKCLITFELYNEAADLIAFILNTCREQKFMISNDLIPLFCELFRFKRSFNRDLGTPLKEALNYFTESSEDLKGILRYCNDAIQGRRLSTDVYSNIELLDGAECSADNVILLSLLFEHAQKPHQVLQFDKPSFHSAQNLLKHDVPSEILSENFQLWRAYYLRAFNSMQGLEALRSDSTSSPTENYRELFVNSGSLEGVLKQFLVVANVPPSSGPCNMRLFCASLVALFLSNDLYEEERKILNSDQNHRRCRDNCWFVTASDFWSINGTDKLSLDMTTFISEYYLAENLPYTDWLKHFDSALIHHLTLSMPNVKLFHPLCGLCPDFAAKILPILFNLSIYFDHKTVLKWTETLFSLIERLVICAEAKQKVGLLLSVISMLMMGRKLKEPHYVSCCSALPLKSIYKAALKSGHTTSAYMIFEMLYMENLSDLDHNGLRTIYETIGDVDLLAGLPAPQNLMEALNSATVIEPKAWKTFLYNNALIDAQSLNNEKSEMENFFRTTECQGLYGIAARLSRLFPSPEGTLCEYGWALQLGSWDLPVPKVINSKEKGLYFTLKSVLAGVQTPSQILDDVIIKVSGSKCGFKEKLEWAETIAEITLLKNMAEDLKHQESIATFIQSSSVLNKAALHSHDFSEYKSNTQARFLLSQILFNREVSNGSPILDSLKKCSAALLVSNVRLAVQEKCSQDAMRNAILFDRYFQAESSSPIYDRLRSFVSATALWENGDNKTPVELLKTMLKKLPQNFDGEPIDSLLNISNDEIQALLVKWTSKSRLETPSAIFEKHIKDFELTVKDHEVRADVFYILANFLNAQVKKMKDSGQVEERQKRCERGTQESRALEAINKKANLSDNERKDARRHYNRVLLQLNSDREILNALLVQKVQFVWRSLHYFINTLVFTDKYDGDVLDKFCGLWFEHDGDDTINSLLRKEIGMIPSWKFLPWVNQIASKLSIGDTEFQKPLQLTMKRVLYKLPYDSLYSVLSMKLYENHSFTNDSIIPQKIQAVNKILSELQGYDNGSYYRSYVIPLKEFCEMSVELANYQVSTTSKGTKKIQLQNLKIGSYWLKILPTQKLPLPTLKWRIRASRDGKVPRPFITSVDEKVDISQTGLSLPKIVTFTISNGLKHKVLMKGSNDDLRQDAIMEQVFQQVNSVLQREKQMRKLDLTISTYSVIPLGPRAGIIEFVTNSLSLHQILTTLHRNDNVTFTDARNEMKKVQTKSNSERLRIYIKLTEEIQPQLRNFFFDSFPNPDYWFEAKKTYTKGIATSSIVGYILGLGDRHLNNILLDYHTGRPTHIDLGIAFDQGRLLPIPEMIPFRLTRDIVDGFGVTGVEGLFRRSCERTYSVLRDNYEKVMHVLNILKWDPLYSWVMSPVKKHKHLLDEESLDYSSLSFDSGTSNLTARGQEQNQESYRALKSVEEKLIGNGLSVEATVQELIQQASDPQNLSLVYMGWSPFY